MSFDPEIAALFARAAQDNVPVEPFMADTLRTLQHARRARLVRQSIRTTVILTLAALAAPYAADATLDGISWLAPHLPVALGICGALTLLAMVGRVAR